MTGDQAADRPCLRRPGIPGATGRGRSRGTRPPTSRAPAKRSSTPRRTRCRSLTSANWVQVADLFYRYGVQAMSGELTPEETLKTVQEQAGTGT